MTIGVLERQPHELPLSPKQNASLNSKSARRALYAAPAGHKSKERKTK
jgi:hypothetical protein